jgi:hypothetical protein
MLKQFIKTQKAPYQPVSAFAVIVGGVDACL